MESYTGFLALFGKLLNRKQYFCPVIQASTIKKVLLSMK